uniref:Uncharacterized protein n=1 Tax=Romanomermis culicivorax TaxID=13658 RepID=A0A915K7R8_ROMCU
MTSYQLKNQASFLVIVFLAGICGLIEVQFDRFVHFELCLHQDVLAGVVIRNWSDCLSKACLTNPEDNTEHWANSVDERVCLDGAKFNRNLESSCQSVFADESL